MTDLGPISINTRHPQRHLALTIAMWLAIAAFVVSSLLAIGRLP